MSPRRSPHPHATHIRIWGSGEEREGFNGGKWEAGRRLGSREQGIAFVSTSG